MPITPRIKPVILGALLLIILLLTTELTAVATIRSQGSLFTPAAEQATWADPTITRTRFVKADLDLLDKITVGDTLTLRLFHDIELTAVFDQIAPNYSWSGRIAGYQLSQVTLVKWKGQLLGNIALPGAFYQIRYAGDKVYAIHQLDQSAFPPEMEPIPVGQASGMSQTANAPAADDGSVIDVLVVYTAQARQMAGDTVAMEAEINMAVVETNESYDNSFIDQRLRLVHMDEISYDESDLDWFVALDHLREPYDGYLDRAHTLRDAFCADSVMLIVGDTEYCGLAYMMSSVSPSFESWAFGLVSLDCCATGSLSFGHELGHIMAAHHDWYVNESIDPYPYNHGYVNVADRWRTIMSYNSECDSSYVYCDRLPFWSNPDVSYDGDPMGVPAGTSSSCREGEPEPDCDADNRLVLNSTATTVANFRDSANCTDGPLLYSGYLVNGDDVVDCEEIIELDVDLYNYGDHSLSGVNATISTADPGVTWLDNIYSTYPAIPGETASTNKDPFDLTLDPSIPNGHTITFDLDIAAGSGGPWSDSFAISVACCRTPGTPILAAPANGATIPIFRPTFEWEIATNTSEYQVEIATDPGFTNRIITETVFSPTYTPASILGNGTYYWRTVGRNADNGCSARGDYSDTWALAIHATKVYLPMLTK